MAKMRTVYLEDQTGVSDVDTTIISLKDLPPISAIDVVFRATNGSTSNTLKGLDTQVDPIEVVDGGNVITSLSMSQHMGIHCYQNRATPEYDYPETGGATQRASVRLLFGRKLGDLDYYLDPAAFRNPQLKVSNSLTISATAGYDSGTGTLSVLAHVLEEGARTRRGTIRVREFHEYTSLASGEVRSEIDTKEVLRRLYIRSFEAAVNFETDITRMRIEDGARKRLTDDIRMVDLFSMLRGRYPQWVDAKLLLASNDDTRQVQLQTIEEVAVASAFSARNALIDAISGDRVTIDLYDLATPTADTTDRDIRVIAKGHAPWATVAWDFGDPDDPDAWWDASALEKLYVVLTQGGAGATVQVMAETVMV